MKNSIIPYLPSIGINFVGDVKDKKVTRIRHFIGLRQVATDVLLRAHRQNNLETSDELNKSYWGVLTLMSGCLEGVSISEAYVFDSYGSLFGHKFLPKLAQESIKEAYLLYRTMNSGKPRYLSKDAVGFSIRDGSVLSAYSSSLAFAGFKHKWNQASAVAIAIRMGWLEKDWHKLNRVRNSSLISRLL